MIVAISNAGATTLLSSTLLNNHLGTTLEISAGGGVQIPAILTYQEQGLCDIPDIHIPTACTEGDVGCYIIAGCNVGTTISGTSTASYGGLFQWGNNYDSRGGQTTNGLVYTPNTTTLENTILDYTTYSSTGFIISPSAPNDWTSLDSDGALRSASWNVCAAGYHIPTQSEWSDIVAVGGWGGDGMNMSSALKLPLVGDRYSTDASLYDQGSIGLYWSSSPNGTNGYSLYFNAEDIFPAIIHNRANGFSVRCFKN